MEVILPAEQASLLLGTTGQAFVTAGTTEAVSYSRLLGCAGEPHLALDPGTLYVSNITAMTHIDVASRCERLTLLLLGRAFSVSWSTPQAYHAYHRPLLRLVA